MKSSYVLFSLGKVRYALRLEEVVQIVKNENILDVPKASRYVIGVMNLRGEVFPVIDLRQRFGLVGEKEDRKKRIIVVKVSNRTFGILVDDVREIVEIEDEKVEKSVSSIYGLKESMIEGLVKEGDTLIILLNIKEVIESQEEVKVVK